MDVLFTDWFIYNISDHITIKDLFKLKLTNKWHYKEITLNYLYKIIDKKIKLGPNGSYGYIIQKNTNSNEFTINDSTPITIPCNTYYKFILTVTPIRYPLVATIKGTVRNVFGKIDICSIFYDMWGDSLKVSAINNIIELKNINPYLPDTTWTGTMDNICTSF
jgi:hypothetical protein